MQWTSEAQKPEDYKVVLLQMLGDHFTTGWYASKANNGNGAWIGLALNQSPPVYEIMTGGVKAWCAIEPPNEGLALWPSLTIHTPAAEPGHRHYILIDCWDNDQEITIPTGWRLERDQRWFDRDRYRAVISHLQTDYASQAVTISLKNDTLAFAGVVQEEQIEGLFALE